MEKEAPNIQENRAWWRIPPREPSAGDPHERPVLGLDAVPHVATGIEV
jgi:hypothetical protein